MKGFDSHLARALALGAALVMVTAPPVSAQVEVGTLELGLFGQYTDFRENAGCICKWPEDGPGFGGRAGMFFSPAFSIELDAGRTVADRMIVGGTMSYTTVAARVVANYFIGGAGNPSLFGGFGPMLGKYEDVSTRYGVSGTAGLRFGITKRFALRLDGVADYMPAEENLNLAARAGGGLVIAPWSRTVVPIAPPPAPPPAPAAPASPVVEAAPERAPATPEPAVTHDFSAITVPVYFDFDRADLRPDGRAALDLKLTWLRANPQLRLRLEGNADDRGTTDYNLPLGLRRAIAVRDYLVANGIAADRLEVVTHGDTRPRCTETPASDDCHQVNRRVDFQIVAGAERGLRVPE